MKRWSALAWSCAILCVVGTACGRGDGTPEPSCVAFVECVQARDAERGTTTNVDRFLEGGACWVAADEGRRSCDAACTRGLDVLRAFPDAPEACAP